MPNAVSKTSVRLTPQGGSPDAAISFGHAQMGRFNCYLQDEATHHQDKLASGGTASGNDTVNFPINKSPAELAGKALCWDITIASPSGGVGERYSVNITINQDGQQLLSFPSAGDMQASFQSLLIYVNFQ